MAGQQGQPKYGFGWPDGRLGGLRPPGSTTPAEPLHHVIMILFGIITEGGNRLLVKASKSRLKPVKAGGLDFTNESRLFANPAGFDL